MKKQIIDPQAARLRFKAEKHLKDQPNTPGKNLTVAETLKLVHELEVHQIELELVNEELISALQRLETESDKYIELYELAPVGYITVSSEGAIEKANLAASRMLGTERSRLINKLFRSFISRDSWPLFRTFFQDMFSTGKYETCEVMISAENCQVIHVQLSGIAISNDLEKICLLTMVDITARKHAESLTRESEETNTLFLEKTGIGVAVFSTDGKILLVNRKAAFYLGGQPGDFIGRSLMDIFERKDASAYIKRLKESAKNENTLEFEEFLQFSNGSFWLVSSHSRLKNSLGEIKGILVLSQDITERKRVELKLAESREELKAIYDNSPVMMCVIDTGRRILYANKTFSSFAGVDEQDIIGGRPGGVFGCINALDDPRGCGFGKNCRNCSLRLAIEGTIKTGQGRHNVESVTYMIHDGVSHEIVLLASTSLIFSDSRPRLLLCLNDITDRKRAEDNLAETIIKLKHAQHIAHFGSWENFLPENELLWSDEMYNIMGFPVGSKINLAHAEGVFPPWELKRFRQAVSRTINEDAPYSMEYKIILSDGETKYIHDEGEVIRNEDGKAILMFGTTQDITERKFVEKKLNEKAWESQRMNNLMIGRETKMIELKKEINELRQRLGEKKRYRIVE